MSAGASAIPTGDISGGMPGGGGGDLDLGSTLGSAFDEALSSESTPPATAGEAPPAGDTDLFAADPVVDPAAQPADPNAQPGAEASPYQLSPDGKFYQVPKSELPQFQTAQKYFQQVSQHFATPQEAQNAASQSADLRIMSNDWSGGSQHGIEQVLKHWAGFDHSANPQIQQRYQQSFAKMAEMMPGTLKQINPQAYEGMQTQFVAARVESAYQRAVTEQRPDQYDAKGAPLPGSPLYLAQVMDYDLTGQYKTDLNQIQKPQAQQQMSAEQQRMKEFETREANALKRDIGDFNSSAVEGAKFKQFDQGLDKMLGKIKDRYSEVAFNDLKAGIHRELIDTLKSQSDSFWLEHTQEWQRLMDDYRSVWKQGGDAKSLQPRVQSYIQNFISRANRLLPQIAQKRIGAATNAAQARSRTGQFAAQPPQARQPGQAAAPQQTNGRTSSDQWKSDWVGEFAQFRS